MKQFLCMGNCIVGLLMRSPSLYARCDDPDVGRE
jgi:hypothetical protein